MWHLSGDKFTNSSRTTDLHNEFKINTFEIIATYIELTNSNWQQTRKNARPFVCCGERRVQERVKQT